MAARLTKDERRKRRTDLEMRKLVARNRTNKNVSYKVSGLRLNYRVFFNSRQK
jgi:hypothetical protein